jgi:predicted O-methyltransferase YrrM
VNVDRFLEQLPTQYVGFPHQPIALDRRYAEILTRIKGYTCAPVGALLNFACSLLPQDEIYLEAGSFNGASLACALVGNQARAVAIDNFSEFSGSPAQLQHTLHIEQIDQRVTVYEGEFLDQMDRRSAASEAVSPIGVFFYDADHSYRATLDALHTVVPLLAQDALIVVDDYNWKEVRAAVLDFSINTHGRVTSFYELLTAGNMQYDSWWNGLALLSWKGN